MSSPVDVVRLAERTDLTGSIVAAWNQLDSGRLDASLSTLRNSIAAMIEAENAMLANNVSRLFVQLMARADGAGKLATMLGFYERANISGELANTVTEPRAYLTARTTPQLDTAVEHGRAMSGLDALRYMYDACTQPRN